MMTIELVGNGRARPPGDRPAALTYAGNDIARYYGPSASNVVSCLAPCRRSNLL